MIFNRICLQKWHVNLLWHHLDVPVKLPSYGCFRIKATNYPRVDSTVLIQLLDVFGEYMAPFHPLLTFFWTSAFHFRLFLLFFYMLPPILSFQFLASLATHFPCQAAVKVVQTLDSSWASLTGTTSWFEWCWYLSPSIVETLKESAWCWKNHSNWSELIS